MYIVELNLDDVLKVLLVIVLRFLVYTKLVDKFHSEEFEQK